MSKLLARLLASGIQAKIYGDYSFLVLHGDTWIELDADHVSEYLSGDTSVPYDCQLSTQQGTAPLLGFTTGRDQGKSLEHIMKLFKTSDIERGYISADTSDLADSPLWWHKQGLSQTASGYGAKLTSRYKILLDGKFRRLYSTCYGNAASTWFILKGEKIHIG